MDLDTAEALWILRMLPRERLPDVAAAALQAGFDTTSMRVLAGLASAEIDEAAELFERALGELGRSIPTRDQSVRIFAKSVSQQIVRGELDPYKGARLIWDAATQAQNAKCHDVDSFIYAASEYEERPADREFFRLEIIKEAERWVQKGEK